MLAGGVRVALFWNKYSSRSRTWDLSQHLPAGYYLPSCPSVPDSPYSCCERYHISHPAGPPSSIPDHSCPFSGPQPLAAGPCHRLCPRLLLFFALCWRWRPNADCLYCFPIFLPLSNFPPAVAPLDIGPLPLLVAATPTSSFPRPGTAGNFIDLSFTRACRLRITVCAFWSFFGRAWRPISACCLDDASGNPLKPSRNFLLFSSFARIYTRVWVA